jgi:hypothetical protein
MGCKLAPAHLHMLVPPNTFYSYKNMFFFSTFFLNTNISPQNIENSMTKIKAWMALHYYSDGGLTIVTE